MRSEDMQTPGPFRRMLWLLLLICVFRLPILSAAEPPPQKENRFLFVINTSSAMRRETNAIQQAVLGLLDSGMEGQMRDGDTFGIWTYDDQLHADFPMKVWSKKNLKDIDGSVVSFLGSRRYQHYAHLEKVLPVLSPIMGNSRVLTAIFIYDGSETMKGTGFDKEINTLQKQFGPSMRSNRIPFVTLLAVWNGKPIDFSVNAPAKISMLQTADLIKPPVTNAPPAVTVVATAPAPAPVAKPPPPRHLDYILTNPPAPPPPPVEIVQVPAPVPAKVEPQTTATQTTSSATISLPGQTPPAVVSPPSPVEETPKPEAPASPPLSVVVIETPAPSPITTGIAPAPTTAAASTVPSVTTETQIQPPPVSPTPAIPTAATVPPIVPQTAVVAPPPGEHVALLIIAFSLLTIAVVLVLFFLRRPRGQTSLISQSLDNSR